MRLWLLFIYFFSPISLIHLHKGWNSSMMWEHRPVWNWISHIYHFDSVYKAHHKHVHLCSSPSSSFLYALISISRASFTSSSSWYSLSWAFIRSLSSAISCSFASMARRCLSRSDDRISSNSLIRSSEATTYKSKHADTTQLKPNSKPPEILSCLSDLKCGSCRRGLHLSVLVSIKPHLFLQGAKLVPKALYSGTRLLQLLPGWAHCLVINLRGHFGIIQLQTERDT